MECKNCKNPLAVEDHFCRGCGSKVISEELTFSYLGNEFSESFLNIDNNRLWQTIKDMVVRPEIVIDGYIHGLRRRYLNVANFLALSVTIAGLQIFLTQKFFQESLDMSWMDSQNNPALQNTEWLDSMQEYNSIIFLLMIPLYALFSKIVFLNKKEYSYLKHIVIVSYSQAQLGICLFIPTMILLIFGVNFFKINYGMMLIMVGYSAYVYKRLFHLSLKQIILKTLFFLFIGFFFYLGVGILMWVYWIFSGTIDLNEFIKAQQAAQEGTSYIVSSAINWTS